MKLVFLFFILSAQAGFAATMPEDLKKLAVPFGASVEFVKTPSNSVPTDNPTDELIVSMLKEYQEEVHGKNSIYALGSFNLSRAMESVDYILRQEFPGDSDEILSKKFELSHEQLRFLKKAHSITFGSDGNEEDVLMILAFRTGGIFKIKFPLAKPSPLPPVGQEANPCVDLNGRVPELCIMRADRFHVEDPFIKHRTCGITENAIIEVDIDNHIVRKTVQSITPDSVATLRHNFESIEGIPVPRLSTQRLINHWKVTNPSVNAPTDRALLSTRHIDSLGQVHIDAEDQSSEAQALVALLDLVCPPTEK